MEKYFEKFPIIQYSNTAVVDITKRATLLDKVYNNPLVYYPYAISSEERADQLSYRYYENPYQSWLIYFANKIVDPYYEWYLHEREFNEFVNKKYGSYYTPQIKIKHYKNNWNSEESISVSRFNSLTVGEKKYWEPIYGFNSVIASYKRKEKDWTINTNKIVKYNVANSDGFIKDEICNIVFSQTTNKVGRGQVCFASNNVLCLQHISGYHVANSTVNISSSVSYIFGTESEANTKFSSTSISVNNLTSDEEVYWKPVTYYEYEYEKNEFNKTVQVVDNSLAQLASDNLKDLMKV
jgi:hypothetical protein